METGFKINPFFPLLREFIYSAKPLQGWLLIIVYKTLRLKDMSVATFDWLNEEDLPDAVEALNSVIREGKYLFE